MTLSTSSPTDEVNQLAVLADDVGVHVATGNGDTVCISSAELGGVQHILGPFEGAVRCIGWSHAHALLAVGTGRRVAIHRRHDAPGSHTFRKVAEVDHGEPVTAVDWTILDGQAALWSSGQRLILWRQDQSGGWTVYWQRTLSQRVYRMAVSADGALLATAGRNDRLLKVWSSRSGLLKESSQVTEWPGPARPTRRVCCAAFLIPR